MISVFGSKISLAAHVAKQVRLCFNLLPAFTINHILYIRVLLGGRSSMNRHLNLGPNKRLNHSIHTIFPPSYFSGSGLAGIERPSAARLRLENGIIRF